MFYIFHSTATPGVAEHLAQELRNLYGGAHVSDVRADDLSVPDNLDAGNYWTSAQVVMKMCDMYADGIITSDDTLIFTWSQDICARIVTDLNRCYNVEPKQYWYTFTDSNGLWTAKEQKHIKFEELA
jgi:hypothetical protein